MHIFCTLLLLLTLSLFLPTVLATDKASAALDYLHSALPNGTMHRLPSSNAISNETQIPHQNAINVSLLSQPSTSETERNTAALQNAISDSLSTHPHHPDFISSSSNAALNIQTADPPSEKPPIDSKEEDPEPDTASKIVDVTQLLRQHENLEQKIILHTEERDAATESLLNAVGRKNTLLKERENAAETREEVERSLSELYSQMPRYTKTLDILKKQSNDANRIIERLRNQHFWVMHQNKRLADALRERGLEHWVERSVKDSVSPFVSDALVQGTASVVEPVLDGIEKLATANDVLSKRMSLKLRERVPIVEKPFYAGFVTYLVLLFPTVLVISLALKVKRGISKLSVGHMAIVGNFYFLLLSGGCFIATLLGSVDVLQTFRHHNLQMFDFVMVLHGTLFATHVLAHIRAALQVRDKTALIHTFLLFTIGLHFFVHSYRHAMHNEDPHVDKRSYLVYTGIFLFVLYELTVKQIRNSQDKKVMTLNKTSISASANEIEAEAAASSTVRASYPSTRISFLSPDTHSVTVSGSAPRLRTFSDNPPISGFPPRSALSFRSATSSSLKSLHHVSTDAAAARVL